MVDEFQYIELKNPRVTSGIIEDFNPALVNHWNNISKSKGNAKLFEVFQHGVVTIGSRPVLYNAVKVLKPCILFATSNNGFTAASQSSMMKNLYLEANGVAATGRGFNKLLSHKYTQDGNYTKNHACGEYFGKDDIVFLGVATTTAATLNHPMRGASVLGFSPNTFLEMKSDQFHKATLSTSGIPTSAAGKSALDYSGVNTFNNDSAGVNALYTITQSAADGMKVTMSGALESMVFITHSYRSGGVLNHAINIKEQPNTIDPMVNGASDFGAGQTSAAGLWESMAWAGVPDLDDVIDFRVGNIGSTVGCYDVQTSISAIEIPQ